MNKYDALAFSQAGDKYLGRLYSEMDCQKFVEKCMADVGIQKREGCMYDVCVSVREDDSKMSFFAASDIASLFSSENSRDYDGI